MRHAQEHWLRIQANAAVEMAMGITSDCYEQDIAEEVKNIDAGFADNQDQDAASKYLMSVREHHLKIARDALIDAELLHREIVRRGGRG